MSLIWGPSVFETGDFAAGICGDADADADADVGAGSGARAHELSASSVVSSAVVDRFMFNIQEEI